MSAKPQATYEALKKPPAEARDILSPPGWALELLLVLRPSSTHSKNCEPCVDLLDAGEYCAGQRADRRRVDNGPSTRCSGE